MRSSLWDRCGGKGDEQRARRNPHADVGDEKTIADVCGDGVVVVHLVARAQALATAHISEALALVAHRREHVHRVGEQVLEQLRLLRWRLVLLVGKRWLGGRFVFVVHAAFCALGVTTALALQRVCLRIKHTLDSHRRDVRARHHRGGHGVVGAGVVEVGGEEENGVRLVVRLAVA